jgi:hypothetical protein
LVQAYRQKFLSLIKAHPNAGRKQLSKLSYYAYFWLRRHDAVWLEVHLPPPRSRACLGRARIDWQSEDVKLSAAVKKAALTIKQSLGKARRASIQAVTRETGRRVWIERYLDKLPLTARAIAEHIESFEAFSLRKIALIEAAYRQESLCPTRLQFTVRAGLRNKVGRTRPVQKAVAAAIKRLRHK